MKVSLGARVLALACVQAQFALAQAPVAIVEEVKGVIPGLEAMDYLVPGQRFRVSQDETVVLGYLKSCINETIRAGAVEIGNERSTVEQGLVERTTVECDALDMMATSGQTLDATGYVLRGASTPKEGLPAVPRAPEPQFTLYGSAPLIELKGSGPLVIARLDAQGEYLKFDVDPNDLVRGRFLDLAGSDQTLTPGGVYAARWQKRLTVFRIDLSAKPGATPLLGKLLRLGFPP